MDKVKVLHKILGGSFEGRLERLDKAFASATSPFRAEIETVHTAQDAFQARVSAGQAKWVEVTEDGDQYDHGEDLSERRDDAFEALLTLRKAFTFLIYHQWERLAQHWAPSSDKAPNHKVLIKAVKAAGVPIDEPGMEILRLLVNTLKHNSVTYGAELHRERPDLFKDGFDPEKINPFTGKRFTKINWSDEIELTDQNMDSFMDVVRKSAPRP